MTAKRAIASVLGAAALACSGGLVAAVAPAGADENACVGHMEYVGFERWEPAYDDMAYACYLGAAVTYDHCLGLMVDAIQWHNGHVDPDIDLQDGEYACDLATRPG